MLATIIGNFSSVFKNTGSEGLYGPKIPHSANTVLAKRKGVENQQMGQNPAKDMTRPLGKSTSHDMTVDGPSDTALFEVQAASSQALLSGAQADTQSTFRYQASSQNLVKSVGDFPCSVSDTGKDPVEYN